MGPITTLPDTSIEGGGSSNASSSPNNAGEKGNGGGPNEYARGAAKAAVAIVRNSPLGAALAITFTSTKLGDGTVDNDASGTQQ